MEATIRKWARPLAAGVLALWAVAGCDDQAVGGSCGDGTCSPATGETSVVCPSDCAWTDITAAKSHTCALRADGTVWCWGSNRYGQLGNGRILGPDLCSPYESLTIGCSSVPVQTALLRDVISLAKGAGGDSRSSCAVRADGTAWCWGWNRYGQLGDGATGSVGEAQDAEVVPVQVTGLSDVVRVTTGGWGHSCAVLGDGTAWCWGNNGAGQLGTGEATGPQTCAGLHGDVPCSTTPVQVQGFDAPVVDISAGGYDWSAWTCAVTDDGSAWCWGDNYSGNLGLGHRDDVLVPTRVVALSEVVSVAAGTVQTCATTASGEAYCWGENEHCELGLGDDFGPEYCAPMSDACSMTPVRLPEPEPVATISAGFLFTCATTRLGGGLCWGLDGHALGLGWDSMYECSPGPVVGLVGVETLSAGRDHSCAITADGRAWCWGYTTMGQLGYASEPELEICESAVMVWVDCATSPVEVGPPRKG